MVGDPRGRDRASFGVVSGRDWVSGEGGRGVRVKGGGKSERLLLREREIRARLRLG